MDTYLVGGAVRDKLLELPIKERDWVVVGGSVKGGRPSRAGWAFARKPEAEKFIGANGGEMVDLEAAINAAYEDRYKETRMMRRKRQEMKKMKM